MSELVSIREASRRLGVSDTAIHKAIKAERIDAPRDEDRDPSNGRPRLPWPKVRDQYVANSDTSKRSHVGSQGSPVRANNPPPQVKLPTSDRMDEGEPLDAPSAGEGPKSGRGPGYAQARAAREVYQARLAKLEYEQKVGKLIDADEVKVAWFKQITAAKTRIMGIPSACKSRCSDLPLDVVATIERVCREALEDLSGGREE